MKRREQMLDALVGPDSAEKQNRLFVFLEAQLSFGFGRSQVSVRESVVDRMTDHCDRPFGDTEVPAKFVLHFLGVDEYVITEAILNSERDAIEQRIFGVSPGLIDVVSRKRNFLTAELVVRH